MNPLNFQTDKLNDLFFVLLLLWNGVKCHKFDLMLFLFGVFIKAQMIPKMFLPFTNK